MENEYKILTKDQVVVQAPEAIRNMCLSLQTNTLNKNEIDVSDSTTSEVVLQFLDYCKNHQYTISAPMQIPITSRDIPFTSQYDSELTSKWKFDSAVDLLILATKLQCSPLEELCYAFMAVKIRSTYHNNTYFKNF